MDTVFDLPPYRVGPYTIAAHAATAKQLGARQRRLMKADAMADSILISEDASPEMQFELYVRWLVRSVHYRSGLNESCNEEAFTHSLATGLVEIAQNNPEFWAQFNHLLGQRLGQQHRGWGLRAAGMGGAPVVPKRIVVATGAYTFTQVPDTAGYWAWCNFETQEIELSVSLAGVNLCVIVLHEILHAIHHAVGIDDKTMVHPFIRAQAAGLIRFWRENPRFWSWWLYTLANARGTAQATWPERHSSDSTL